MLVYSLQYVDHYVERDYKHYVYYDYDSHDDRDETDQSGRIFSGELVYTPESFYSGTREHIERMINDMVKHIWYHYEPVDISTEDKCIALLKSMEPGTYKVIAHNREYDYAIVVACHEIFSS